MNVLLSGLENHTSHYFVNYTNATRLHKQHSKRVVQKIMPKAWAKPSSRAELIRSKKLLLVPSDLNTIDVAVFIDASFATNEDLSSRLKFIVCLKDDNGTPTIFHYTLKKCN